MEDNEQTVEDEFQLYELVEENGKRHSTLRVPRNLPQAYSSESTEALNDVFNIFMGDCSGSMCCSFPHVVTGWQNSIQNNLTGRTKIFVFGSDVHFRREGHELNQEDDLGGGTDLTAGLKTVRLEVEQCKESNIRVFIVTDGQHGGSRPLPETEIERMLPPAGKTVSVYLLGIGSYFPVNYSVDLRSNLHNGNANVPTLFWAKSDDDIENQMAAIGDELNSAMVKLKLNIGGNILPGLDKTQDIHLGEWIYFDQPPEELSSMSVMVNEEEPKDITLTARPANMRHLLDYIFRQWNSVLIQQHRRKSHVPREVYDLMDSLFNYFMEQIKEVMPTGKDIKSRLNKKRLKTYEVDYKTLKNQSKSIIDVQGKYQDELELAETILKTTVTNRKYDMKNLQLKGHGVEDYEKDMESFQKLYLKVKTRIMALPAPTPEECCRVMITSTLTDMQDPDFHLMFEESKFDLLKTLTMTGIPIYAPVRDASQINPWTMVIKHILVTPFSILSQQVLEQSAVSSDTTMGVEDKDVILQQDNEKTRFNAIVPIVPASAAEVLKPLVLSNIYAMMATFCILKNPHIVDYNAHLAALGCTWIRTIREFPVGNRAEFARHRVECIEATAKLYMDRPSVKRYVDAMINNPKQALMTESTDEFDGKSLKCESLIKPAFFMYLKKDKFSQQQVSNLLKLMTYEFVGRCLSNYKADEAEASPFTDFFCAQLTDPEMKKTWLGKHCKAIIDAYQTGQGNLLEQFYTLDDLLPGLKTFVAEKVAGLTDKLLEELTIAIDMKKVKSLSNFGACGDIRWSSFHNLAQEMGIPRETIEETFSPTQAMIYVTMALQIKSSKERLAKDFLSADEVLKLVTKKVIQENTRTLRGTILKEVEEFAVKQWRDAYMTAHSPLVMPLTPEQVVEAAQARGIAVTQDTFCKVYRYNDRLKLLRNACQISGCPHYLQPHNNFNQHLAVERETGNFPHSLHLVSRDFCDQGINGVVREVVSGKHTGTKNRKRPPTPDASGISPLEGQLETLLKLYSEDDQSSTSKSKPPQQKETDNETEEFFDCTS